MLLEVFKCIPLTQVFIFLWKDISSFQLKLKEKRNSLRIISAVIESMKHWSQYTYKTALLFEVLGKYGVLLMESDLVSHGIFTDIIWEMNMVEDNRND